MCCEDSPFFSELNPSANLGFLGNWFRRNRTSPCSSRQVARCRGAVFSDSDSAPYWYAGGSGVGSGAPVGFTDMTPWMAEIAEMAQLRVLRGSYRIRGTWIRGTYCRTYCCTCCSFRSRGCAYCRPYCGAARLARSSKIGSAAAGRFGRNWQSGGPGGPGGHQVLRDNDGRHGGLEGHDLRQVSGREIPPPPSSD